MGNSMRNAAGNAAENSVGNVAGNSVGNAVGNSVGYYWLPLATIDLVDNNREFEV